MRYGFIVAGLAILLHVGPVSAAMPSQVSADGSNVSISASASTTTPYRNQPIRYTIKCVVRGGISKVSMDDISVANAIVERQGKPKVYDQAENGVPARVVEIHYLITPLQSGKMVVPPAVLKGEIQAPALAPMVDPFGGRFMLSPRAQQAMNFFSAYGGQDFAIASNQVVLDVKPSIGAMDPWLPLRSLRIKDDINASQPVRVGDLVTRKIRLLAEGVVGAQLPALETQQNHEDFGVYADKPATGEDVDGKTGAIFGWRNESYSLIPQRVGRLVLPAIKVRWWDVVNKKIATTELPARDIVVLPSAAVGTAIGGVSAASKDAAAGRGGSASAQSFWARVLPGDIAALFLYGLVGVLFAVLVFCAVWFWLLRRRTVARGATRPQAKKIDVRRTLKKIRSIEELREFLRSHGQERLGKPANASLEEIFLPPPKWWKGQDRADVAVIVKEVNAALYGGKPADLEDLKKRCRRIIAALRRGTGSDRKNGERLPSLNPS